MAVKYVYFLSFDSNQSKSAWKVPRSTLTLLLCSVSGYVSSFKLFFSFHFKSMTFTIYVNVPKMNMQLIFFKHLD